jgi:D-alanine-D-alanine ligase
MISLRSAKVVGEALDALGYSANQIEVDELLAQAPRDDCVVFNLAYGRIGEGGQLQAYLEKSGVPYTGSGSRASALCFDKVCFKKEMQRLNIETPLFVVPSNLPRESFLHDIRAVLKLPVILKPVAGGSSVGLCKVDDWTELQSTFSSIKSDARLGPYFAEEYVRGTELSVCLLERDNRITVMPIAEIFSPSIFTEELKGSGVSYRLPQLAQTDIDEIAARCRLAFTTLGLRGWGKFDLIVSEKGTPYMLECDTIPGMGTTSVLPWAVGVMGMKVMDVVQIVLDSALRHQGRY